MCDSPALQWGSKRTGPDLARVGGRYSDEWQVEHLTDPRSLVPESIMPRYGFLAEAVLDPSQGDEGNPALRELVKALGVAGFAAGNIMQFSVSIWSGANEATRELFNWISAIIALPAILYSGRIFFRSA